MIFYKLNTKFRSEW